VGSSPQPPVKPAPFEYHSPRTLDEALTLLAEFGSDAKPLAGGQSLIPAMNFRLATPAILVDLNSIAALAFVTPDAGVLRLGGMTRHRTLERDRNVARFAPLVSAALPFVAHPAIRTRGTIGGSLAHADPAAELPAVMLALNATFTLQSRAGTRHVRATDFFTGLFMTTVEPGVLLTEIVIPQRGARSRFAFDEISRRHGDYALAGAAAAVTLDADGTCAEARVALLSVGDRPILSEQVSRRLVGRVPSPEAVRDAADDAADRDIDPPGDIHASSRYRRQLARVLIRRVLQRAIDNDAVPRESRTGGDA